MIDYKKLAEESEKDSPYIKFGEDGEIQGILRNIVFEDNPFDKGKKIASYYLEMPDGTVKSFKSGSKRLMKEFITEAPGVGDLISIARMGELMQTMYRVKILQKNIDNADKKVEQTGEELANDIPF